MLPLLLLAACSTATVAEPPKTLRKPIDKCPSVGYYFERQDLHNYPCYLCYCNNDGYAVCTLRDKERCENNDSSVATSDARTSVEIELKERSPSRRSRRGLMELFFENAKKDVMLKSISKANEEDCKPKASKSIGCPPKDWCTGCLVCDCDDNGEWQCHVMSFCEDNTPRPKARKSKKLEIIEIDNEHTKKKKPIKRVPPKKNDKRSVKPKKYDSASDLKKKKNTKTNKIKPEKKPSTTSTTTSKPKPKIAVKTLQKFIRKSDMKKGSGAPVIVIKKYISTISPIDSPELLKYKNDPSKLAQILYQQHEASSETSHNSHAVKREIKLEKILHNKQKRHFELKYNARGRKPMNTKEHNDWNKKMKARKTEHEHLTKQTNSFYSKHNEVLNPDENRIQQTLHDENKHDTGHSRKRKVILIPRKRRNKRNVRTLIGAPISTVMKNKTVNVPLLSDQVETLINTNKENISDINNYKYIVENMVTKKYDNEITNSGIIYESTSKYVDINTNDNHSSSIENTTAMGTPGYTEKEVETTTQQFNYDVQSLDLKNYTIDEMFSQVNQLKLKNNRSLGTNASVDYKSEPSTDKEFKIKGAIDTETTTVIEENQVKNNTNNKISNHRNMSGHVIKKAYITDIDTIITQLNRYTLEKLKKNNVTNKLIANIFTIKPNNSINITRKHSTSDLEKLLQSFTNNIEKNNSRQNQLSAIKYLKKIYSQLLSTKNNKSRLNNIAVMESICDTFGPCKISSNKIEALNLKIDELISETKKALDVIRIIKGILQLLDGESNSTDKHINEEVEFKSYVKKLNAVLTDTYKTPLTETQMTQMNYIKNNTKIFINSIGKFAFILNDILEIIHSERARYESLRTRKILIKKVNRHKVNAPLHKIKNLFLKFNVLQNSFMRNMYQAISELEMQNEHKAAVDDKSLNHKRDTSYQSSVNKYMNKINYNLEKLKVLALRMGAKEREKRNTMDHDDAVDYLLTLMEYLLKHNNPLKSPQVADGIDLLIDAIRRAPDIRPLKKKSLKQSALMPKFPPTFKIQSKSKSSSESEDDKLNNQSDNFKDNVSFIKKNINDRIIENSKNDIYDYRKTTSDLSPKTAMLTTSTTTKYVDVEDLVFNGDVIPKVYMATVPPFENMGDIFIEKEKPKLTKLKIKINESASDAEDESSILAKKIKFAPFEKTEKAFIISSTEKTLFMTQFDRINEEYEKQIQGKAPSLKSLKIRNRKKTKRLRKKQKSDTKSNVSSVTKEVDKEKTRKKVVKEETIIRKQISTSTEYDPFQIDDESASRDVSPLDASNNDIFPSYFS